MRTASTLIVIALLGCTKEGAGNESSPPVPVPSAKVAPTPAAVTVAITAVNLAGACGHALPDSTGEREQDSDRNHEEARSSRVSRRACEQTSMQLSMTGAAGGTPTQIRVKRVELFDDKGTLIGELTSRTPTVWSQDGAYRPWDQMVAPAQTLSVSYALSEPRWGTVTNRWNRTYVLRAVLTIGGTDRTVAREVHVAAPATLPADVET